MGTSTCRLQFQCKWDSCSDIHACDTLKKESSAIWDVFHTLLGFFLFFFKIWISAHVNKYVVCLSFTPVFARSFVLCVIKLYSQRSKTEMQGIILRWMGMWKGWAVLNRNSVVGKGLETVIGFGDCETVCKYWPYLEHVCRTRSNIG